MPGMTQEELQHWDQVYSDVPKVDKRGIPFVVGDKVVFATSAQNHTVRLAEVMEIWTGPYYAWSTSPPRIRQSNSEPQPVVIVKIKPDNLNRSLWRSANHLISLHGLPSVVSEEEE